MTLDMIIDQYTEFNVQNREITAEQIAVLQDWEEICGQFCKQYNREPTIAPCDERVDPQEHWSLVDLTVGFDATGLWPLMVRLGLVSPPFGKHVLCVDW